MDPSTAKNHSVARRLALLSLAGLTVVLLVVSVAIGVIEQRSTHALMVSSVAERVQGVVAAADASDQINRELMLRSYRSFRQEFDPTPSLNEAAGELSSYGVAVNNDFTAVDKFTKDTGGVATVFVKKGEDFQRVTTSLKSFTQMNLAGVVIVDHWVDSTDGSMFALAKLDVAGVKASLDKAKELDAKVRDYVRANAEKAFDDLAAEEAKH